MDGFDRISFSKNETELARFEKLYPDELSGATDFKVDCARILKGPLASHIVPLMPEAKEEDIASLRMVARKGGELPVHILAKSKKNRMSEQITIPDHRKKELSKLADFISSNYKKGNVTQLEDIIALEESNLCVDH